MRISSVIVPAAIISSAAASPVPQVVYVTNYITVVGPAPSSSSSSLIESTSSYSSSLHNSTNATYSSYLSLTSQTPIIYSTQEASVSAPAPAPVPATSEAAAPEPTTEAQATVAATSAAPATTEAQATSEAATTTQATTTTDSGSGSLDGGFALEMINAHNQYRQLHQAPNLSWDLTLALYAQANADSYSCSGSLQHTGGPYGENLAAGYSSGLDSVSAWYNEINDYDWSSTSTFNHFTQVVWKSTTKLGCAYKDCRSNNWGLYVVCEYDPAGNMIGEVSENVLQ